MAYHTIRFLYVSLFKLEQRHKLSADYLGFSSETEMHPFPSARSLMYKCALYL